MPATIQMSRVEHDLTSLAGGLDQLTPSLILPPGAVRESVNYECVATVDARGRPYGGYARIGGYERFDGRPKPSGASYTLIQVTSFTNVPSVGDILTGQTSAATGVIIVVDTTGLFMILTKIVGTFTTSEVVKVGATTIGTTTPSTTIISPLQNAQYTNLAADQYRADIAAVPGSGPVRGVVGAVFSGVDQTYAFRDNAGGTAVILYKATTSGWTTVTFYNEVSFTAGGTTAPADGATLTQGANTATIKRVVHQSGSWAGGTAAGRFIVTTPTPGNFGAGAATIGAITVTLSGIQTAITLAPGGKFEFDLANFSGQVGTVRLYGCDNVNRGFEFDGDVLVPITTGTSPDSPKYVRAHKNHLLWAIKSSLIHSGTGLPYMYLPANGGGEIAVGDTLTGMLTQPGAQDTGALFLTTLNNSLVLYGTSAANWNLVFFGLGIGALDYTHQTMFQGFALDDIGIINLRTVQEFGNFEQATLTNHIQTLITDKRSKVAYSSVFRGKSQYRLFFNDGSGLYLTIVNGIFIGVMPVSFPNAVFCAWNGMLGNGNEIAYFGAASGGFVYQLDVGSSFDGENLDAYLTMNWNTMKAPRVRKRYRKASLEMQGSFYASIMVGYQLGYGTAEIAQPSSVPYASGFAPAPAWDTFTWDAFTWDGRTLFPTEVDLTGTAENIQYAISSTTDYIMPYTLNSIITHFSQRRAMR